jgi:indole-3-glycerol phosphate synthase
LILDRIVASKQERLAQAKAGIPLAELRKKAESSPPCRDFAAALRKTGVSLIAEIKRASPSRGLIRPDLDPAALSQIYGQNGAAAISVLTEQDHFQGDLTDLLSARSAQEELDVPPIPLLRKDFIFDAYQVYEARAFGADAVLLIVAILDDGLLRELLALSNELGMSCLVEVHDEAEMKRALAASADVIGVNNRDLHTFEVYLDTTRRLQPLMPDESLLVSESGIKSRVDIERLSGWGVDAVLVGEALVAAADVGAKVRELA